MSRIPLIGRAEAAGEVAAMFEVLQQNFRKVPNLFATVAHHPPSMRPLLELFDSVYNQTDLEPRLLEMVVIKIAYGYQSHYCLTLHKAFALERGLSNEDIERIRDPETYGAFPDAERAVLEVTDQFAQDPLGISDEQFERLRGYFDEEQVVTLVLLMGLASLFGQLANALRIPIDDFIGAAPSEG